MNLFPLGFLGQSGGGGANLSPYFIGYMPWNGSYSISANSVAIDSSNNIWTVGYGGTSRTDLLLFKLSNTGVLSYQSLASIGSGSTQGFRIAIDGSNNIYVSGHYYSSGAYQGIIVKYNSSGVVQWANKQGGTSYEAHSYGVTYDASGNVYSIGYTSQPGYYTTYNNKVNSSGTYQYDNRLGRLYGETKAQDGVGDGTGIMYMSGYDNRADQGLPVEAKFVKWNTSGGATWQRRMYDASNAIYSFGGASLDGSGNFYSTATVAVGYGVVVKYNSSGTIQWQRQLSNTYLYRCVADSSGNVYVGGADLSANGMVIAKYNSSGTLQWQRKMTASASIGYPYGMALESGTNLVISSTIDGDNGLVMKLPTDGSLTGTYTIGAYTFTYAANSATATTSTWSEAADSYTAALMGNNNGTVTPSTSTPSFTFTKSN